MAYLTLAEFKLATIMPDEDVDDLDDRYSGWFAVQLENESAWIDARLRKRYAAPFESPYPKAVVRWLAVLVTVRAYYKRGVDPTDAQMADIVQDAKDAKAEITEAANSVEGLFDLPLRADSTSSGISKGGPLGYSEASPYVWKDRQACVGREEDANGEGSGG